MFGLFGQKLGKSFHKFDAAKDPENELYKKSLEVTNKPYINFCVFRIDFAKGPSIAHGDPQKWAWSDDWWWGILYIFKNKGVDIHGILLLRTLIGKIFGSIGSVGGALALGKEGPLVHTSACIASLLGQDGSTKYHINSRWFQVFKSDRDRRDLVTCGSATGVSAAFRAPVGGVLFALEECELQWDGVRMEIADILGLADS
ncbi:Chloride channel protein CLC-d [Arachis hypogaea]|uniref:Chloride channel protein CLC-d n=1 Tax=Arachis hypogaea TaxID=3818 RepID=A0A6B9V795_ARAHY|nr:Chloride channel protein CLC-d [Arachis hypogaea]